MTMALMRLNFVHENPGDRQEMSDRYRAGIEMARHVDGHGFSVISTEEHHNSPVGWSPTPLLTAGMILSNTKNVLVSITALILPLHDPLRVAEDLAVLDLVSRGRIAIVTGIGYRPEEYAAHDKDWSRRGKLLDEALDLMFAAWSGEPFERNGHPTVVNPLPYTQPHPIVMIGGRSKVAARRAARRGLPFQMPGGDGDEAIEAYYYAECDKHGNEGFCIRPTDVAMVHVAEDPDRVWDRLGHHFMLEAMTYKNSQSPGHDSAVSSRASTVEELRTEGIYQVLTPEQAIDRGRRTGMLALHPLVGGMPIDEAWNSVQLTTDKVMPALFGND